MWCQVHLQKSKPQATIHKLGDIRLRESAIISMSQGLVRTEQAQENHVPYAPMLFGAKAGFNRYFPLKLLGLLKS